MFVEYCRVFHPIIKNEDFLFYTVRNGIRTRMSPDNVLRFMNKYEKQIKEKQPEFPHLHPHLFRHTRAMHLYLASPLPLVSEWLGHSQLEATTIYARATTEMKRKALERISPLRKMQFLRRMRHSSMRTMTKCLKDCTDARNADKASGALAIYRCF